ncbi:hypothetical protein F441_07259 [Phytophthora nicotianae CJ01A1]|uniref:Uncharacterized protein n=2 Tax=Phytophthora nicotianae TaxID=4792 RepID=W2X9D9_PHYNI|nr:hypothetical protein L915_07116 [Phytophthora nicotianae]ETP18534.1 hypothetical protein F441_07259 [Phytophthora nicotianae CJ01A1]
MQAVQNCATGSYKGGRLLRQFDRVRAWRTRSFNTGQLSFREMKQDDSCANYSFEHSASLIFLMSLMEASVGRLFCNEVKTKPPFAENRSVEPCWVTLQVTSVQHPVYVVSAVRTYMTARARDDFIF